MCGGPGSAQKMKKESSGGCFRELFALAWLLQLRLPGALQNRTEIGCETAEASSVVHYKTEIKFATPYRHGSKSEESEFWGLFS